jgi:hypothetical protein
MTAESPLGKGKQKPSAKPFIDAILETINFLICQEKIIHLVPDLLKEFPFSAIAIPGGRFLWCDFVVHEEDRQRLKILDAPGFLRRDDLFGRPLGLSQAEETFVESRGLRKNMLDFSRNRLRVPLTMNIWFYR